MNKSYYETKLPENLDETVQNACARGARELRRRKLRRWGTVAAAACAAFVLAVNVPTVSAALADVPVLGNLVRVLQIGGGGERTDGAVVVGGAAQDGAVRLSFQKPEGLASSVPAYTAERFEAPNRLVLTFNGVRNFDLDALEQSLRSLPQAVGYYRDMLLDDSAIRIAIELAPGVDYDISEYKSPGYIDLRLFAQKDAPPAHTVYFLRSNAMPQSESLALLAEMYSAQNAVSARTASGEFVVTMGAFATRAEAEAFAAQLGNPAAFWVDSCSSDANPA